MPASGGEKVPTSRNTSANPLPTCQHPRAPCDVPAVVARRSFLPATSKMENRNWKMEIRPSRHDLGDQSEPGHITIGNGLNEEVAVSSFQFPVSSFQFPVSSFQFPVSCFSFASSDTSSSIPAPCRVPTSWTL